MKILYCTQDKSGCGYYRMKLPSLYLSKYKEVEYSTDLNILYDKQKIKEFSNGFIVLQRPKIDLTNFFVWCKEYNIYVINDIDDALWAIPVYNAATHTLTTEMLDHIFTNLKLANCVTCSTEPLKQYIQKNINCNVEVIPNKLEKIYPFKPDFFDDRIHIGFAGSASHNGDFTENLISFIKSEVANHRIRFTFFGNIPSFLRGYTVEIGFLPIDAYHKYLYDLNLDIGLIVGQKNEFNDCRSNLKYLEYSSCGICSVAVDTYPFKNCIIPNQNGILIHHDNWDVTLKTLINNKSEIKRIAKNAYEDVKLNYLYQD